MDHNFDTKKSPLELHLEKAATILERTHPEQTSDAMSDYAAALAALGPSKDPMVVSIEDQLKRLYIYPNRKEHNTLLIDLYDLKELLYEARINEELSKRDKEKNLGETTKTRQWPWFLVAAIALFVLFKP